MTIANQPRPLSDAAAFMTGTAIAAILALWALTWRKDTRELDKLDRHLANGEHLVAVFWHGKYFSLFALAKGRRATVVTSRSFRGDVIARICRWFGYRPIQIEQGVENQALIQLENDLSSHDAPLAAIAIDGKGRILFLFSREPFTMWEFNRMLLTTPLDVKRAMHAEGGPEASLSIHAGGVELDLSGSFETGFNENNTNPRQWAIPNVLGVSAPPPGTSP